LNQKLHRKVEENKENLKNFQKEIGRVNIIRSVELLVLAYEFGILDRYISSYEEEKDLLDGILWGIKLRGCSISTDEINSIMKIEGLS
jgi:hypothetical protein